MNKLNLIFWCLVIILTSVSCKSIDNKNHKDSRFRILNLNKELVFQYILTGEVISIDSTYNVFEIKIEDDSNRKYKILTKKVNYSSYGGKDIIIGQNYKFKVIQLTFSTASNSFRKMNINGKEIKISPSHYIKDCIKFNRQEFCNDVSWDVYEALNLINLKITGN